MSDRREHRYIGASMTRLEDQRLLTGAGRFVDDVKLPGMAAMAILRSPHAHARITSVDLAAARALPGVIDAFAADDVRKSFRRGELPKLPLRLTPFEGFRRFLQEPIATDRVRFVGEPVAVVVAEDRYVAEDALELVEVGYETLPAVVDLDAAAEGKTLLHEDAGENIGTRYTVGRGDVEAAFAGAAYTRKERFHTNRHAACPMETRGLVAEFDAGFDAGAPRLRLHGATKVTYYNRDHLAEVFRLPSEAVELIETDVGGGFGARGELYPEDYLVPIAAMRTGRPVKWIEDRRENLMACNHSREIVCDLEIAADADGHILALRGTVKGDMGAYIRTNGGVVPVKAVQFLPGPYRIGAVGFEMQALVTNKTPVGTYRGPGRVEANFCRERLIDMMAADLGIEPAEIRRRNLLRPDELPSPVGELVPGDHSSILDDGDYPAAFARALAEIGYEDWRDRQGEVTDGVARAVGLACFVESAAGGPPETARITAGTDGRIEVRVGASSVGQGVETGMAQICAELLEVDPADIDVLHGTTTLLDSGGGTFNSRNTVMAGNAVRIAAEKLRAISIDLAGLRLNEDAEALEFADGGVCRRDDPDGERLSLREIAAFAAVRAEDAETDGVLCADGIFSNEGRISYSYGAHAALVAVDIGTGQVRVERYAVVEDIGRALNPALVHGQAIGGLMQGLGGALLDHMVYDADGQLLTGSFADYLLPTTTDLPEIVAVSTEGFPSTVHTMGFKGAGEGGIVAVAAAVGNAVALALSRHGVPVTALPLSPDRLRAALRAAGA